DRSALIVRLWTGPSAATVQVPSRAPAPVGLRTAKPVLATPAIRVKFPPTKTRPEASVARAAIVRAGAVSVAAAASGDGFQVGSTAPVVVSTAARPERAAPPRAENVPPT